MKHIRILITVSICTLVFWACSKSPPETASSSDPPQKPSAAPHQHEDQQPSLAVTGEVTQEIHMSFGDNPDVSPVAYHVAVTVQNVGKTPLVFDTVEGAFLPKNGRPLRNVTHNVDKDKGDSPEASAKGDIPTDELAPGAARTLEFTTDGYTFKLLRDAGDAPLRFGLTFGRNRAAVTDSFVAILPDLKELPSYEKSMVENTKGKTLAFTQLKAGMPNPTGSTHSEEDNANASGGPPRGFEYEKLDEISRVILKPTEWHSRKVEEKDTIMYCISKSATSAETDPSIIVKAIKSDTFNQLNMKPSEFVEKLMQATKQRAEGRSRREESFLYSRPSDSVDEVQKMYTLSCNSRRAHGVRGRANNAGNKVVYDSLYIPLDEQGRLFIVTVRGEEEAWDRLWEKGEVVAKEFFGSSVER